MSSLKDLCKGGDQLLSLKYLREHLVKEYPDNYQDIFTKLKSTKNLDLENLDEKINSVEQFKKKWGLIPIFTSEGTFSQFEKDRMAPAEAKPKENNLIKIYKKDVMEMRIDLMAKQDDIIESVKSLLCTERSIQGIELGPGRPSEHKYTSVDFYLTELIYENQWTKKAKIEDAYRKAGKFEPKCYDKGRKNIKKLIELLSPMSNYPKNI